MTAGMAAAEGPAWSGVAKFGMASNDGGDYEIYNHTVLTGKFTGTTEGGLEYGADWSHRAGRSYSFSNDVRDGFNASPSTSMPEVFIRGSFGKLSVKENGYNFFYNDDRADDADLKYELSVGDLSFATVYEATAGHFSTSIGMKVGAISGSVVYDSASGGNSASASYALGDITATLGIDPDAANSVKVAYANSGLTASVKIDDENAWTLAGGLAQGNVSVSLETNSDDEWTASGSYALGAGAKVEGGVNHTENAFLGLAFTF